MKKTLSIFLAVSLLVSLLSTVFPVSAADETIDYVAAKLSEIQQLYPSGSFFTRTGEDCGHSGNCSSYNCNCLDYKGSIQCMGFGKMVFNTIFGLTLPSLKSNYEFADSSKVIKVGVLGSGSVTVENLKNLFGKARMGDVIQTKTRSFQHTLVYVSRTSEGITVYDNSWFAACEINQRFVTWDRLIYYFSGGISVTSATNYPSKGDPIVKPAAVAVTGVKLNVSSRSVQVGKVYRLTTVISPASATNWEATWKSSDPSVATVDSYGRVTGIRAGSATITATTKDGGKTATCAITVTGTGSSIVPVTGITLDVYSLNLKVGGSYDLTGTAVPSNATNKSGTWSSSNTSVATVGSTGIVTAIAPGTANITVTTNDGGKTATCAVTVTGNTIPVTGVKIDVSSKTINVGGSYDLTGTISPSNATNRNSEWTSSDPSIATVGTTGIVKGLKAGKVTITLRALDNGMTATCAITVASNTIPVTSVKIDVSSKTISVGGSYDLTGTISPSNATNRKGEWISSDPSIATVGTTGIVKGLKAGKVTITLRALDNGMTATCAITVTGTTTIPVTGVKLDVTSKTINVGGSYDLTGTVLPTNATNRKGTWTSSDTSIATVGTAGLVKGLKAGTAIITLTTSEGGYKVTCTITVKAVAVTKVTTIPVTGVKLDVTSKTINVGGSYDLTGTVLPTNATNRKGTWTSSNTSIATVGTTGLVKGLKAGTAIITLTTAEGGYKVTCTITVKAVAVTGVKLNYTSKTITKGSSYTLTASLAPTNATVKTVTWTSSNTAVATVSSTGKVTAIKAGTCTITVKTKDGGKTATCKITVK